MEELLKELLEEQKKTNELLQVIVSNKEQIMKIDLSKLSGEVIIPEEMMLSGNVILESNLHL